MEQEITISGQHFTLHISGAAFWREERMLIISDVHLGKVMHFRKYGMAVPAASVEANFTRLSEVSDHFKPSVICFLGDLFHSSLNREWFLFEDWVRTRNEKLLLIRGNHDIISPAAYNAIGIETVQELVKGQFVFVHEPEEREDRFTFCGHLHPGIRITGMGKQQLTLPCFYRREYQLIFPAFGTFTGKFIVQPGITDTIYAIAEKELIVLEGEIFNRN